MNYSYGLLDWCMLVWRRGPSVLRTWYNRAELLPSDTLEILSLGQGCNSNNKK